MLSSCGLEEYISKSVSWRSQEVSDDAVTTFIQKYGRGYWFDYGSKHEIIFKVIITRKAVKDAMRWGIFIQWT